MTSTSRLDQAYKQLKLQGFRLTQIRKDLVKFILGRKSHWTIQSVATQAKKSLPKVGIATVYRTVNLLQQQGYLTETYSGSGSARYEVTPEEHHDHLTCIICGKIVEFENAEIEQLQETVAKNLGFELVDHRMELYGKCPRCKEKGKRVKK